MICCQCLTWYIPSNVNGIGDEGMVIVHSDILSKSAVTGSRGKSHKRLEVWLLLRCNGKLGAYLASRFIQRVNRYFHNVELWILSEMFFWFLKTNNYSSTGFITRVIATDCINNLMMANLRFPLANTTNQKNRNDRDLKLCTQFILLSKSLTSIKNCGMKLLALKFGNV